MITTYDWELPRIAERFTRDWEVEMLFREKCFLLEREGENARSRNGQMNSRKRLAGVKNEVCGAVGIPRPFT